MVALILTRITLDSNPKISALFLITVPTVNPVRFLRCTPRPGIGSSLLRNVTTIFGTVIAEELTYQELWYFRPEVWPLDHENQLHVRPKSWANLPRRSAVIGLVQTNHQETFLPHLFSA